MTKSKPKRVTAPEPSTWQKYKPTPKVAAQTVTAALVALILWVANEQFDLGMSEPVAVAIVVLLGAVAGWFRRDSSSPEGA